MSTRQLSDREVFDFLANHSDIAQAVQEHEQLFLVDGHPDQWNQILAAQNSEVPIPARGLAVSGDATYSNVIVFPDASGILHFIATDNNSLANEVQKPAYASDPAYWEMFSDLAQKFGESLPTLPQVGMAVGAVAVIAILLLASR